MAGTAAEQAGHGASEAGTVVMDDMEEGINTKSSREIVHRDAQGVTQVKVEKSWLNAPGFAEVLDKEVVELGVKLDSSDLLKHKYGRQQVWMWPDGFKCPYSGVDIKPGHLTSDYIPLEQRGKLKDYRSHLKALLQEDDALFKKLRDKWTHP